MNINDITISDAIKIGRLFSDGSVPGQDQPQKTDMMADYIGKKVILRDHKAGLFCTTLTHIEGCQWRGGQSRKIHYWSKAGAIEGVATTGIDLGGSRITMTTTTSNGYELVQLCPCADSVYAEIMEAIAWNPK